jgi:hypothetical protein
MRILRMAVIAVFALILCSAYGYAEEDLPEKAEVDKPWEVKADTNNDGVVDEVEWNQWKKHHPKWTKKPRKHYLKKASVVDKPWEAKADVDNDGKVERGELRHWKKTHHPKKDKDNNPPGAAGGPGTNWENPPGPKGGPGASPNRRGRRR